MVAFLLRITPFPLIPNVLLALVGKHKSMGVTCR